MSVDGEFADGRMQIISVALRQIAESLEGQHGVMLSVATQKLKSLARRQASRSIYRWIAQGGSIA